MSNAVPPDRPLPGRQREARANDEAVLTAARAVFATHGHGASMADIARRAGVGVGSLYRRYPTKDALVEALHLQAVLEAARLVHEVADQVGRAVGAVGTFLARQIAEAAGPLLRPPGANGPLPPELAAASADLRAGLERLIDHDRGLDLVPDGFTPADVMQLLLHLRPAMPLSRADANDLHLRYLNLVMRGLREEASTGRGLPEGRRWDEWEGAWHSAREPDPSSP